jgi:hypothetical protein
MAIFSTLREAHIVIQSMYVWLTFIKERKSKRGLTDEPKSESHHFVVLWGQIRSFLERERSLLSSEELIN